MGRASDLPTKPCVACGRDIRWRKKWERDWDNVRYCSDACRRRGVREIDLALERAIIDLLSKRAAGATICPSEAARAVDPSAWESLMDDTRRAANRLVAKGDIIMMQRGQVVDPSSAKGAIRLRLP